MAQTYRVNGRVTIEDEWGEPLTTERYAFGVAAENPEQARELGLSGLRQLVAEGHTLSVEQGLAIPQLDDVLAEDGQIYQTN